MNELGLTRETVREMTEEIVEKTVTKHLNRLSIEQRIENLVTAKIIEISKEGNKWKSSVINETIRKVGEERMAEFMAKNIKITITPITDDSKGD